MEPRTFYRIWSPTRGYWCMRAATLSDADVWSDNPVMAVSLLKKHALATLKRVRTERQRGLLAECSPCPDARLIHVTVRRNARHLTDLYAQNAMLTEALRQARAYNEASISIANADRAALRARVSELEAQLADRTDALRTFQNVPREE